MATRGLSKRKLVQELTAAGVSPEIIAQFAPRKQGRKPLGATAMTNVERQRKYKEKLRKNKELKK